MKLDELRIFYSQSGEKGTDTWLRYFQPGSVITNF